MVFTDTNASSSSETDDISLILRHLFHRSSSSSSSSPALIMTSKQSPLTFSAPVPTPPPPPPISTSTSTGVVLPDAIHRFPLSSGSDRLALDRVSPVEPSAGLVMPFSTGFPVSGLGGGPALSSSPVGPVESESTQTGSVQLGKSSDNDVTEEYDCESEERLDPATEEVQPRQQSSRGSSKRTRAAEVHNLSEKRRRSRINEKMRALQNLIPNSNKTDKASMLDEAIEYLKQLQLQVQMLSMRNGLSLHPMGLPGVLHPFQLNQVGSGFADREGPPNRSLTGSLSMDQDTQGSAFNLSDPYASSSTRTSIGSASNHNILSMLNQESCFGLQSSTLPLLLNPFISPSENICREDSNMHQQTIVGGDSEASSLGTSMQLPCVVQPSDVSRARSFEGCLYQEGTDVFTERTPPCR